MRGICLSIWPIDGLEIDRAEIARTGAGIIVAMYSTNLFATLRTGVLEP